MLNFFAAVILGVVALLSHQAGDAGAAQLCGILCLINAVLAIIRLLCFPQKAQQ